MKLKDLLNEKSLADGDIKDMISTLIDKTKDNDDKNSKNINQMASEMKSQFAKNGGLSPEQVGWLMKTMKALS